MNFYDTPAFKCGPMRTNLMSEIGSSEIIHIYSVSVNRQTE